MLVLTQRLCDQVVLKLTGKADVAVGMRYGEPSIHKALDRFRRSGVCRLIVLPLYPQFSASTTSSVYDAVEKALTTKSPLLVLTQRLCDQVVLKLTGKADVAVGMRYGEPSIHKALDRFRRSGVCRLIVLPLYPQFSASTTSSVYDAVEKALTAMEWQPEILRIEKYHDQPGWIEAVVAGIRAYRELHGKAEKLMFSMHGLPQRFVDNGDPYEDQCRESIQSIVSALELKRDEWLLTYQSRVGRELWLQPYTDITLQELAKSGVKHIQVVCPGFAVDCLETLEEIELRNRERFIAAGGEKLEYIPALNDSEQHADLLLELVNL